MTDRAKKSTPVISVVIPMRNEADNINKLFQRLESVLAGMDETFEIICVNDGSIDDTEKQLREKIKTFSCLKVVSLSRGFGKERALSAGLDRVGGDAVVVLDADLQNPPEAIPEFIKKWREGYDVVYGVRNRRYGESPVRKYFSNLFYKLFNRVSDISIPQNSGDFRLMDRRVVDVICLLPESNRFMKGLFAWVGFRQIGVNYDQSMRTAGHTKWNLWRLWNFALDGITGFSTLPLRLWSYIGVGVALGAIVYALYLTIKTLILGVDVPGYASLMAVVLFLGGIQLITLGVLGEYLGRMYRETKRRPIYVVREQWGFDDNNKNT